jgi:ABC-type glycerol-3-phosphate transport system substrate-binding protein
MLRNCVAPYVRRLVLACLVGLLAGCARAAPAREPVTITCAVLETDAEYLEALVDKFAESHPQITVELRPTTGEDLENFQAESADVLWVSRYLAAHLSE